MEDLGAMSRLIMKNLTNGVEFCKSFGDPTKPRAWSKHAQKPSQPKQSSQDSIPSDTKKVDKKNKVPSNREQLKEDAEFQEFLSVHQKRAQVAM